MKVRSRAWLIARTIGATFAQPFRWAWRLIKPEVTVETEWVDATNPEGRAAVQRFEQLLAKKGHRALGLPTPPKDPRKRREWIVRMAHRHGRRGARLGGDAQ